MSWDISLGMSCDKYTTWNAFTYSAMISFHCVVNNDPGVDIHRRVWKSIPGSHNRPRKSEALSATTLQFTSLMLWGLAALQFTLPMLWGLAGLQWARRLQPRARASVRWDGGATSVGGREAAMSTQIYSRNRRTTQRGRAAPVCSR